MSRWFLLLIPYFLFILLRVPSLFEPHWYGDEGIFAAVARALESGKKLYVDVFDNRTPGIYYLYALMPAAHRLLAVRIASLIAGLITLGGVEALARLWSLQRVRGRIFLVLLLLLGTPLFEANIAHNEHFFLPLTVWGVYMAVSRPQRVLWSGFLFGLAFLIKFHPIFTASVMGVYLFLHQPSEGVWSIVADHRRYRVIGIYLVGFCIPLVIVGIYFYSIGSLQQAITYSLLNNTAYVDEFRRYAIPLELKTLVALGLIVGSACLYQGKKITETEFLLGIYLVGDLYAAIFSGRQYEHYLLQIAPAVALCIGWIVQSWRSRRERAIYGALGWGICLYAGLLAFYRGAASPLRLPVVAYYRSFISYASGRGTDPPMLFQFGHETEHMEVISQTPKRYGTTDIFYFADLPWAYDMSGVTPPTFFVAAYHLSLVPQGPPRLVTELTRRHTQLIVVDKVRQVPVELDTLLIRSYQLVGEDDYFRYYRRS